MRLLHDLLDAAAAAAPPAAGIRSDGPVTSYRQLARDSRALAAGLAGRGVGRGDRVALLLPAGLPAVTTLFASSRLGAIFTPINPEVKPYHLRHLLQDARPAALITTAELARAHALTDPPPLVLEEHWPAILESAAAPPCCPAISCDPVALLYTSGSTGWPKAIVSAHANVLFATEAIQSRLRIEVQDTIGSFLPLSFDYGLYQIFLACRAGATVALGRPEQAGPGLLATLRRWGATGLPLVPALATTLVQMSRRTSERPPLRFFTNTGAHLARALIDDLAVLYPDARTFVMFGLTECKRVSILDPEDYPRRPTSVGKPLPDTECLIVDAEGHRLPPGRRGELVVRGPHVMLGYWNAPELTARRFRPWGAGLERALYTGDTCSLDEEGFLYFHGRSDDIYKQGGFRVSALEIEVAALDLPGVRQAALVLEEALGAVLYVTGTLDEAAVRQGLRERLEDFKIPSHICKLAELPRTPHGKIDKQSLRQRAAGGPP
jgi:amino acid adenylation domain-containing protein